MEQNDFNVLSFLCLLMLLTIMFINATISIASEDDVRSRVRPSRIKVQRNLLRRKD